ncbi:phage major capsid protein [Actinoplanes sp. CA-142083]|uniref:phage major capsid protein n=1 Tax=Actinoplanes sp. CA-142083 TaxID=3239903 RepID=UPI003D91213F
MRTIEEITAAMTALVDGAAGRSLTDEEVTQYEEFENELKAVQRTDQIRARNAAYNTVVIPAGVPRPPSDGRPEDTYAAAFDNYMRTGKENADLIRGPVNVQSEGVPTEGGYLVPDEFRVKLIERLKAFGGIAAVAERYTTGTGAPVEWPTLDDTGNTGEIVQEGNTFSAGADLVFGTNSLTSYSYMSGGANGNGIKLSRELVQDAAFDLTGKLTNLLGTRIGRIQAVHWATGSGVSQPLGLFTGRTPVQNAANTGITYEDLVSAIHSVDPAYRKNARWVMNDLTLSAVEKIKDGSGSYIFRGRDAAMALGLNEETLLGYPLTIDQACATVVNNSPTVQWGAFGDITQGYVIRDIKSVELLVNPYSNMNKRQVEYTAWARADATQQDTNAYVTLSGHS